MAKYAELRQQEDPFHDISLLSQATMYWARPYLVPDQQANESFVNSLASPVDLESHAERLQLAWDRQAVLPHPSFFQAVAQVFGRKYLWYMLPFVIMAFGQLGIAVAINLLTETLKREEDSMAIGLGLAGLYSAVSLITVCAVNQGFFRGQVLAGLIRASVFKVIYDKALQLPARQLTSEKVSARLSNLVASELDIIEFLNSTWYLFITPLFIVIATPVVYWLIGPAGLAGVAVVLLFLPLKSYLTKFVSRFRTNSTNLTEQRLKATQSLIEGVKSIKMYAWEPRLLKQIRELKRLEYKEHSNMNILRNMTNTFFISGGSIIMLITLAVYVYLGNELIAGRIFGAVGILLSMNNWVTGITSWGIDVAVWYQTLFRNITEFMSLPEQTEERHLLVSGCQPSVEIADFYASWSQRLGSQMQASQVELARRRPSLGQGEDSPNGPKSVLQGVNLTVKKGELVIIIGVLGSGKSSLLSALSGDLKIMEGRVEISSSLAYVTQEPWVISGSVKENITLGAAMDDVRYWKAVDMCGLRADFNQMPKGDLTFIGDRGSTISGGQKARISLARAVYRNKEVYLLDDPLSAVDAHVGLHIFNECIVKGLKGCTRLLVTHHHKYLPHADRVVIFKDGKVLLQGTYEEVRDSEELQSVLSASGPKNPDQDPVKTMRSRSRSSLADLEFSHDIEEEKEVGSVPASVYLRYFLLFFRYKSILCLLFLLVALLQAVYLSSSYWVSYWAVQTPEDQKDLRFVYGLAIIICVLMVISVLRNYFIMEGMALGNVKLHNLALEAVAATDLSFFDVNPQGRILSRFTKDVAVVEDLLLRYLSDFIMLAGLLISYMVALIVTTPLNIVIMLVVLVFGVKIARRFVPPTRNFKRLELATKADLVGLISSTISGIPTIRSLDLAAHFQARFARAVAVNFKTWFCFFVNQRTFQVLNDFLGMLFLSLNAFTCVLLKGAVPADVLAVGFSFTVLVISYLGWFSDVYINVGNFMISAHRLFQYTELQPEQDPHPTQPLQVSKGQITFQDVCLRYAPHLDLALRGLDFRIEGGTKTGIVGRTGAGKSSLLLALFRLKSLDGGQIFIDGQDISLVSLKSLRSQISVIPQSPLLFHGDVRKNVDPTDSFSPIQVDQVLHELQLLAEASAEAHQLSAGQKQLLCLARILLRNSQILICDEATGSIDPKTEDFVQSMMRSRLQSKTVVTIAHRLKTVQNCDLVVVLDQGRCVEQGAPSELATQGSYFSRMLQAAESSG